MEDLDTQGRQNNWRKSQVLMNGDSLMERDSLLKQAVRHMGINRLGMPRKSEKSKSQREKNEAEYYGFVDTEEDKK